MPSKRNKAGDPPIEDEKYLVFAGSFKEARQFFDGKVDSFNSVGWRVNGKEFIYVPNAINLMGMRRDLKTVKLRGFDGRADRDQFDRVIQQKGWTLTDLTEADLG